MVSQRRARFHTTDGSDPLLPSAVHRPGARKKGVCACVRVHVCVCVCIRRPLKAITVCDIVLTLDSEGGRKSFEGLCVTAWRVRVKNFLSASVRASVCVCVSFKHLQVLQRQTLRGIESWALRAPEH